MASAQGSPDTWDTPTLYSRACAACHGADGSGLPEDHPNYANFDPPPADLTDPLFNSREPAADWALVIKYGGARLGLSQQMPGYEAALSDEQIDDLVGHLKTLADTSRYPPGDLNFLRPILTTKAFPEDEALIINGFERSESENADLLLTTLYYGFRFGARFQGEVKANHINPQAERSELEEIELGFKWAFYDNLEKQVIWALGLETAIPIEDDSSEERLIPYFSVAKGISDSVTFQGTLRASVFASDLDRGAARLSGIFHWMPSIWPRSVSPALEFAITEPLQSGADSEISLIPQLYAGLSKGGHVAFSAGVQIPLSDADYKYRVRTFLLWDIADGPFWRGW